MICVTHPALSVVHGFFGNTGGVSKAPYAFLNISLRGGDMPERVQENRRRALSFLGLQGKLFIPHQDHTNIVHVVRSVDEGITTSDALVTKNPDVVLGVSTADCCPLLLHDPVNQVIAAIHAGWRGAVALIIPKTIEIMVQEGADHQHIVAVLGPCIRQKDYEVGQDMIDVFDQEDRQRFFVPKEAGKYLFDLAGYALAQMRSHLVHVYDTEDNTFDGPFFSCRRAKAKGQDVFGCGLSAISLIPR